MVAEDRTVVHLNCDLESLKEFRSLSEHEIIEDVDLKVWIEL